MQLKSDCSNNPKEIGSSAIIQNAAHSPSLSFQYLIIYNYSSLGKNQLKLLFPLLIFI